jgi:hypothetical protein
MFCIINYNHVGISMYINCCATQCVHDILTNAKQKKMKYLVQKNGIRNTYILQVFKYHQFLLFDKLV